MYICIYVYMYVSIHAYTYIYIYIHIHLYTHMYRIIVTQPRRIAAITVAKRVAEELPRPIIVLINVMNIICIYIYI